MDDLLAHREWVGRVARTLVYGDAEADDLEQRTWVRVLEHPPAEPPRSPRGWLRTVLRYAAVDLRRSEGTRRGHEAAAAVPERDDATPEALVAKAETLERLVHAVLALEEPYRGTVLLRYFEDLPPREVARRQGVPVETVRTRTRRALERLRERLDGSGTGGRAAWMAAMAPLTGVRWESGLVTGGAAMASKAAIAAAAAGAVLGGVLGAVSVRGSDDGVAAARTEIAALRDRIAELETRPAPAPAVPPVVDERMGGLERRVEALEASPARGSAAAAGAGGNGEAPGTAQAPAETPEQRSERERKAQEGHDALVKAKKAMQELQSTVEELRRRALDRSLSDEERILALQKLRFMGNGINDEVIRGMTAFFRETTLAGTRDAILRELHNRKSDEVKALFLEALRGDPDEKVRARAAEDIDTYRDDPAVVQALESAVSGDASEEVRRRAARTLESKGRK
jgi:RNA polymerase sigma-70 factor (ECF subfamily)